MKPAIILCAMVLVVPIAFGQTSPEPQASGDKKSAAASSPEQSGSESTGAIVEFIPNESLVINTGGSETMRFKLAKKISFTNPRGKVVTAKKLKKDRQVQVHYSMQGGEIVADQVTLVHEKKHGEGKSRNGDKKSGNE